MNQRTTYVSFAVLGALATAVASCSSTQNGSASAGHGDAPPTSAVTTAPEAGPAFTPPACSGCTFAGPTGASDAEAGRIGIRPAFGPTVTARVTPPPISGGTLRILSDGVTAVASDPDRDAVYVADTAGVNAVRIVRLEDGDEPGRLVEDGAGRVHVALRHGGALVTIDPRTGSVLARRAACPAPRGVDWDAASDVIWIACATGELMAFPAAGGAATTSWTLERDLRDVLVADDGSLVVTTFRAAHVLRVSRDGVVRRRDPLGSPEVGFEPHVAWRCVHGTSGSLVVVHQVETDQSIPTKAPNAYGRAAGGAPSGVVQSVVSVMGADGSTTSAVAVDGVLPVDVALAPDGNTVAVAVPGSAFLPIAKESPVVLFGFDGTNVSSIPVPAVLPPGPEVPLPFDAADAGPVQTLRVAQPLLAFGSTQAVAVAFDGAGELAVQTREPARIVLLSTSGAVLRTIDLSPTSRDDTGHDIFHTGAGAQVACASCHPEGGDDGFVWKLDGNARRTPSLRGTIQGTAPYHWPGDEVDFATLTADVYTNRMGGGPLDDGQTAALEAWVEAIPAPPAPSWVDVAAAARGRALFDGPDTACSSCHAGAKLTNNTTVDVGTGAALQVPPLVGLGWRFPFLHDGCARTLADRFAADGGCATPAHGHTSQLSPGEIADLIAYLETL